MIELTMDGKKVKVKDGERVLWAALDAGVYVPHLCAGREIGFHPGACRLCFVEIEGRKEPVLSCSEIVKEGMVVNTRSERVDRLVTTGFELLMSTHRLDCRVCPGNGKCALQEAARIRKYKLRQKRFGKIEPDWPVDESRTDFGLNPNHCVLCGKCVYVCNEIEQRRVLDFSRRGMKTVVSTFNGRPLSEHECGGCLECVKVCPVGALYLIEERASRSGKRGNGDG